jgi:predicted ATPase/DNA-binding XRE family transcriptional regulator
MDRAEGFGAWVRERRKELWLTQKKLARLVGCAPVTVQKIEESHRRPSPTVAEALARHLEIGPADLASFLRLARTSPTMARAPTAPRTPSDQIPLPLTALIGREAEVSSLNEIILRAPTRLLTLTGPPGVGKTRLALQLAQDLRHAFADGVYFVPLAALDEPEQVMPSVIRRLGFADGGAQPRLARLQAFLCDRQLLLILDNFEHLLAAAPAFSGLLEQCPGLRVVVTSRSALRLYGEQEWPVEPLPLPGLVHVADNPAVRLFLERVRAFDPMFSFNSRNAASIAEVVTRLEGLPLALELAAVRLRHASPEELAAELRADVLTALGTGPTDWPERQRTLQGAIAWSYERLEDRLKQVFRHVGLFVGGFDAPAAAALCGARAEELHALVNAHLIQRDGSRYTLLETLRAYALERLTAHEELRVARDAHLEHYLKAVRTHEETDLDWFEAEVSNLRAALRWALDNARAEPASRLALGTAWFWVVRNHQLEGLEWFKAVLALSGSLEPELRMDALDYGATFAWQTGGFELSERWSTEALALSREARRVDSEAALLMERGKVAFEQGHYQEALDALQPGLVLSRLLNIPWLLSGTLFQLANTTLALGDQDKAQTFAEEGLEICRNHPGLFHESVLVRFFGELALERRDFRTAQTLLSQALRMSVKDEGALRISQALADLAAALIVPEAESADLLRAARLWGAVEAIRETNGYLWSPADRERLERWMERARARVADLEWNLAWASGRSMTLPEALEHALAGASHREKARVSRS